MEVGEPEADWLWARFNPPTQDSLSFYIIKNWPKTTKMFPNIQDHTQFLTGKT